MYTGFEYRRDIVKYVFSYVIIFFLDYFYDGKYSIPNKIVILRAELSH